MAGDSPFLVRRAWTESYGVTDESVGENIGRYLRAWDKIGNIYFRDMN